MNFLIAILIEFSEYILELWHYIKPKYLHITMFDPDTREPYEHRFNVHFLIFTAYISFISIPDLSRISIVLKVLKWDAGILISNHKRVRQFEIF